MAANKIDHFQFHAEEFKEEHNCCSREYHAQCNPVSAQKTSAASAYFKERQANTGVSLGAGVLLAPFIDKDSECARSFSGGIRRAAAAQNLSSARAANFCRGGKKVA